MKDITPQPPERGSLQSAAVFMSVVTKLKFNYVTKDIARWQFPLPGGQGVREGKK